MRLRGGAVPEGRGGCRLLAASGRWPRCSALPKMAAMGVNKVGAGAGLDGSRGPGSSGRGPAGAAVKVRRAARPSGGRAACGGWGCAVAASAEGRGSAGSAGRTAGGQAGVP